VIFTIALFASGSSELGGSAAPRLERAGEMDEKLSIAAAKTITLELIRRFTTQR
jgi:hypothetical protein